MTNYYVVYVLYHFEELNNGFFGIKGSTKFYSEVPLFYMHLSYYRLPFPTQFSISSQKCSLYFSIGHVSSLNTVT